MTPAQRCRSRETDHEFRVDFMRLKVVVETRLAEVANAPDFPQHKTTTAAIAGNVILALTERLLSFSVCHLTSSCYMMVVR